MDLLTVVGHKMYAPKGVAALYVRDGVRLEPVVYGGPVPIGQHMANLRRMGGLGKDPERAAKRAKQLAAIDPEWNCPWPLNRQRHYRVLAGLAADEPHGHLPDLAPCVPFDDDIGH